MGSVIPPYYPATPASGARYRRGHGQALTQARRCRVHHSHHRLHGRRRQRPHAAQLGQQAHGGARQTHAQARDGDPGRHLAPAHRDPLRALRGALGDRRPAAREPEGADRPLPPGELVGAALGARDAGPPHLGAPARAGGADAGRLPHPGRAVRGPARLRLRAALPHRRRPATRTPGRRRGPAGGDASRRARLVLHLAQGDPAGARRRVPLRGARSRRFRPVGQADRSRAGSRSSATSSSRPRCSKTSTCAT